MDWGQKWFVVFNAGKTQLILFDQNRPIHFHINNTSVINTGDVDVKMDGSVLKEKSSSKMLGLIFSSKLDWDFYIISIAKSASKKLEYWFVLWSFFLLSLLCISINLPYSHIYMKYCCHVLAGAPSCYLQWCIQMYFGTVWMIWVTKKMCPKTFLQHFFHIYIYIYYIIT